MTSWETGTACRSFSHYGQVLSMGTRGKSTAVHLSMLIQLESGFIFFNSSETLGGAEGGSQCLVNIAETVDNSVNEEIL